MPTVVPVEHLTNAVTWNSTGWQVAFATGPTIAGLVIAYGGGPPTAYFLAAGAPWPPQCWSRRSGRSRRRTGEPPSLASLLAGAKFIWRTKLILATLTLDLFAVLFGGAIALLPAYSKTILHVDAWALAGCGPRRPSAPWRWPS